MQCAPPEEVLDIGHDTQIQESDDEDIPLPDQVSAPNKKIQRRVTTVLSSVTPQKRPRRPPPKQQPPEPPPEPPLNGVS